MAQQKKPSGWFPESLFTIFLMGVVVLVSLAVLIEGMATKIAICGYVEGYKAGSLDTSAGIFKSLFGTEAQISFEQVSEAEGYCDPITGWILEKVNANVKRSTEVLQKVEE